MLSLIAGVACDDDNTNTQPFVDLRYDAKDSYALNATNADLISFVVKSNLPWEVTSNHTEWCDITPSTGEADDKYTVKVQYHDNTELDDRIDTLIIKSDYWIGKWVVVKQKGIAYLTTTPDEKLVIARAGGEGKIAVNTNQKWTAKVTEGSEWLSISNGQAGEGEGEIVLSTAENLGEIRRGTVIVYDRHEKEASTITVEQEGIVLQPAEAEIRAAHNVGTYELDVDCNTRWTITKDDQEVTWYSFEKNAYEGKQTLKIHLDDNMSPNLSRKTSFTLRTVGENPIEKKIVLKQCFNNSPVRYYFNEEELSKWEVVSGDGGRPQPDGSMIFELTRLRRSGMKAGIYTIHAGGMTSTGQYSGMFRWYTVIGETEIRTFLTDWGVFDSFTYSSEYMSFRPSTPYDCTQDNIMVLEVSDTNDGYVNLTWYLNGVQTNQVHTGEHPSLHDINMSAEATFIISHEDDGSTMSLKYWEFQPSVNWEF